MSDADLPLYYQAADIAILPYKAIFNSGSALMCVSQGLPVLLPSSPNFEEYKNLLAGSLFTYTSLNISTLKDIFTSQQTTNIDTNKTEISWPCIADRTLELYLKVLNTKKTL